MEDGGLFYVRLVDLTAIWYFWEQFSIFYFNLVYFFLFWYVVPRKIWQPCLQRRRLRARLSLSMKNTANGERCYYYYYF
jgi:hypothetical protein